MAQPVVGEMEMHSVANLATLQTPLATFFPFKKAPKPYSVSENRRYCRASMCTPHAHLSLSLSLSASASASASARLLYFCSARGGDEQHFQLNTNMMLLL